MKLQIESGWLDGFDRWPEVQHDWRHIATPAGESVMDSRGAYYLASMEKKGRGSKTFYIPGLKFPKPSRLEGKPSRLEGKPSKLEGEPDGLLKTTEILTQLPKSTRDRLFRLGKKPAKTVVTHMILEVCRDQYLTASQLADLFGRNRDYFMTTYISPMLSAGELEPKHPQESHPQQAYRAKIARDAEQPPRKH